MAAFPFIATVDTDTLDHARQVMSERFGYDEEYEDEAGAAFDYTVDWATDVDGAMAALVNSGVPADALLAALAKAAPGLRFSDAVRVFAERDANERDDALIAAACEQWVREGEVEIDSPTIASSSDEGAYVLAWVWVDDPDYTPED